MKNKKKNYIVSFPAHCSEETSDMMHDAVCWFLARYNMQDTGHRAGRVHRPTVKITLNAVEFNTYKCWGQCYEWDNENADYVIDVAIDQSIRDMLATLFHECVHLWQWERGHWKGEGEREATRLQYELADEYWRLGNV